MARRHVALLAGATVLAAASPGLAVAAGATGATRASPAPPVALVVVAPRPFAGPRPAVAAAVAPVPAGRPVRLEVALRPSHPAEIGALLRRLYTPSSPQFHRFLSRGAFLARFHPSATAVARLRAYLAAHHLRARARGFALDVAGEAADVASAFHVHLVAVGGRAVAAGPFLLPRTVAGPVAGVLDAGARANLVPHFVRIPLRRPTAPTPLERGSTIRARRANLAGPLATGPLATGPAAPSTCAVASELASANGAVTLGQLGARYGVAPLLSAGDTGHGVTVAVYELAAHSPSDVAAYLSCAGISPTITTVPVDGGGTSQPGGGTTEADLDLEQVATQAPGATILSYEGPATAAGQYDVWAAIVGSDQASVVSTSWGLCEAEAAGAVPGEATLFQQAAAQGQTIVAAAGDSGSEDCYPSGSTSAAVDFPASDPYVTGVGGTTLAGPTDVVWNTCGSGSASCAAAGGHATGGGVSSLFAQPSWQGAAVPTPPPGGCGSAACRAVPDLSVDAGTTELIYDGGGWVGAGGTSTGAPFVAGVAADLADSCAGRLGDLAPALYAMNAASPGTGLSDVTSGTNDLTGATGPSYAAAPGYDLASGLGTPIASGLACPSVSAVTPAVAPAGSPVTLTGSNLGSASVRFGTVAATIVQAGPTSMTVDVPAGSGTVTVQAASPLGGGAVSASFTYGAPAAPASPGAPVGTPAAGGAAGGTPGGTAAAGAAGQVRVPGDLRATVVGREVVLTWHRPAGDVLGLRLSERACPVGRPCRLEQLGLAAGRTKVTLALAPGRYAFGLESIGASAVSAVARRLVRIVPGSAAALRLPATTRRSRQGSPARSGGGAGLPPPRYARGGPQAV